MDDAIVARRVFDSGCDQSFGWTFGHAFGIVGGYDRNWGESIERGKGKNEGEVTRIGVYSIGKIWGNGDADKNLIWIISILMISTSLFVAQIHISSFYLKMHLMRIIIVLNIIWSTRHQKRERDIIKTN